MLDPTLDPHSRSTSSTLVCRWCAQEHAHPVLRPGERALCVRCGGLLAKAGRFKGRAALAFSLAGLILAVPAILLPLLTVDRLRGERVTFLLSGFEALWDHDMKVLSFWVLLCGTIAPVILLVTLVGLLLPPSMQRVAGRSNTLERIAHAVEEWAMPEVYVLAVLVALTKLGTLVNVTVGPGLWCYAAMALMILLAWRSFELEPRTGTASARSLTP